MPLAAIAWSQNNLNTIWQDASGASRILEYGLSTRDHSGPALVETL